MRRTLWLLGGVLFASMVTWASGQARMEGPNAGGDVKESKPQSEAVDRLALALRLAAYGDREKDPIALLAAARILKQTPSTDGKREKEVTGEAAEKAKDAPKKPMDAAPLAAEDLLKKAQELAGDDVHIKALAQAIEAEKSRGATRGPVRHRDQAQGRTADRFTIEFQGGEIARVAVSGDHSTDLDLYVFDQNNNMIVSDTDATDTCFVEWTPRWTGPFQVLVVNNGQTANVYDLYTN